jgi:hypothetical protein
VILASDPEDRSRLQFALEYLGEGDSTFKRLTTLTVEELLVELERLSKGDLMRLVLTRVFAERQRKAMLGRTFAD